MEGLLAESSFESFFEELLVETTVKLSGRFRPLDLQVSSCGVAGCLRTSYGQAPSIEHKWFVLKGNKHPGGKFEGLVSLDVPLLSLQFRFTCVFSLRVQRWPGRFFVRMDRFRAS